MNRKHFDIDIETTVSHEKFKALRALDERVAHAIMNRPPHDSVPPYSTSLDLAAEVEAEIERRGLEEEYIDELEAVVGTTFVRFLDRFALVHATPEQRCRAAYKAVTKQ